MRVLLFLLISCVLLISCSHEIKVSKMNPEVVAAIEAAELPGINPSDNPTQAFWHVRAYEKNGFPIDTPGLIQYLKSAIGGGSVSNVLINPVVKGPSFVDPARVDIIEPDGAGFRFQVKGQALMIIPIGPVGSMTKEVWFCDRDGQPLQTIPLVR